MPHTSLLEQVGNTDIYLLDQILKGRYRTGETVLDAGAGGGRNLHWFVQNGIRTYGIDSDPSTVENLKLRYPEVPEAQFQVALVEQLPFSDGFFDHLICCAVLHFARDPEHFEQMFAELMRVLRPGGSLFIRVATDIGIADKMTPLGNGRYHMPDGTDRFLVTRSLLDRLVEQYQPIWIEPFKTLNLNDLRCMATLVWEKR